MKFKKIDVTGKKFGHLTVVKMLYGYKNNNTYCKCICDCGNEKIIVKDCLKELNLNDKVFEPKMIISTISGAKDKLYDPKQFKAMHMNDNRMSKIADVYALYQDRLKRNSALDFDDLIEKVNDEKLKQEVIEEIDRRLD